MYDQSCLSNTKKAWLDIEETLQANPSHAQALACLKRVRHLLNLCIEQERHDTKKPASGSDRA
jgi:hypothetical protein